MRIANSGGCLDGDIDCFLDGQPHPLFEDGFEIGAGDILHHQVKPVRIKTKVMDGDDVGMREVGSGFGFRSKTLPKSLVSGVILAQNFNRYRPFQHQIAGVVNHSHPTVADVLNELIAIAKDGGDGFRFVHGRVAEIITYPRPCATGRIRI